jgi:hypothetical protein
METVFVYLDALVTFDDYLSNLEYVFSRLLQTHVKLSLMRCAPLGNVVSKDRNRRK